MPRVGSHPTTRWACRIWCALLLTVLAIMAARAIAPDLEFWDVAETGREGQLTVYNNAVLGGFYGLPVELGDYDADGRVDLVLAPMAAPSGPLGTRARAGEVYVYSGSGDIAGILDRSVLAPGDDGLTLMGARAGDFTGTELYTADVNGDGIDDLLVSAQNYDLVPAPGEGDPRINCGAVFIVLGRPGLLDGGRRIDLLDPPAELNRIAGATAGERLGIWVEAGDLDADGYDDLAIGADQWPVTESAEEPRHHAGKCYVLYGRDEFPPAIDLASFDDGMTTILGRDSEDHLGSSLHTRDLDGDGYRELIVAAALDRLSATEGGSTPHPVHGSGGGGGPDNTRTQCGEVYVFSPDAELPRLPRRIDLAEALDPEIARRMTTIYGARRRAKAGEEITTGDFDGDGLTDLVIGAITDDAPNGTSRAGSAHLIYWQLDLEGQTVDLSPDAVDSLPEGLRISAMYGLNPVDILGDTLSAGDFNHDGFDDLALGIPHYDATADRSDDRGMVAVIFGRPAALPRVWFPQDLGALGDVSVRYVIGAQPEDLLSYSMEARDFDGDGYDDLFPNSMRGDGSRDQFLDAGEAVLLSGYCLSGAQLRVDSVTPALAPVGEPVRITVSGSGFTTGSDSRVFAGGQEALETRVLTGARLEAVFAPQEAPGSHTVRVVNRYGSAACECTITFAERDHFIRGDTDRNGLVEFGDPMRTLQFLFFGPPISCRDAADTNDDGRTDLTDAIYSFDYLFQGGPPPPPPFPSPGEDPTSDLLDCGP